MISMRALIDGGQYFDRVAAFYRMFSGDVSYFGDDIVVEPAKITRVVYQSIASLLTALRQFGLLGEKRFIIVSHGNPNGLPLRIVPGNSATLNSDFMDHLSGALAGQAGARESAMSYANEQNQHVFQSEQPLDQLLTLIRDVRGLRLEHLEFRGCNLGAGPALRSIHTLLGARLTAAPKVRFVWSQLPTVNVRGTSNWLREEIARLPPHRRVYTRVDCLRSTGSGDGDGVFALAIGSYDAEGRPATLLIRALNADIIKGFTQSYLQPVTFFAINREPMGGGYRPGGLLPLIGFHTPDTPERFVFPGDGAKYTDQIAYEMGPPTWLPP